MERRIKWEGEGKRGWGESGRERKRGRDREESEGVV